MTKTVAIVRYSAIADQVDTALQEIAALVATVRSAEPECSGITMIQNTSDPTQMTLMEHWPSEELFLGPHMQQPHIQAFIQAASAFLAGPPDISFWRPISNG